MLLIPEPVARADGSAGFIFVVVIYAILAVVGKLKQASKRNEQPPRPVTRPAARPAAMPRMSAPPARRLSSPQASVEARRLEELLRGLAQARSMENTESLEVDGDPVDQDSDAEALVQRRIQAAEARNRPLNDQDHAEFDKRRKQEEAKGPVARTFAGRDRLRNAIVWREILGPPLALRDHLDS